MKRFLLPFLLVPLMGGCGPRPQPAAPPKPAPAITEGQGEPIVLSYEALVGERGDYTGRVLLLDFSAAWSAPCLEAMPALSDLHTELAVSGFSVLGLLTDVGPAGDLRGSLAALTVDYEIGRAGPAFMEACGGVRALPTRILLDRKGRIFRRYEGAVSPELIRKDIALLL